MGTTSKLFCKFFLKIFFIIVSLISVGKLTVNQCRLLCCLANTTRPSRTQAMMDHRNEFSGTTMSTGQYQRVSEFYTKPQSKGHLSHCL